MQDTEPKPEDNIEGSKEEKPSYYYDDAHGYEEYDKEIEDDDEEFED